MYQITKLNADCDSETTTITLASGDVLPKHFTCVIEIDSEKMLVKETNVNICTVVRAWQGTTPASHSTNTPVTVDINLEFIKLLASYVDTLEDTIYARHSEGTSFPANPSKGDTVYRTDLDQIFLYTG
jgi:hypothetical protein